MTDNLLEQNQGNAVSEVKSTATPEAKAIPQWEVNRLIGEARQAAHERGLAQGRAEAMHSQAPVQHKAGIDADEVKKVVSSAIDEKQRQFEEQAHKAYEKAQADKVADELRSKLNRGREKYKDWDSVTGKIDWNEVPDILHFANTVDNSEDIIYDLSKEPHKMAQISGQRPHLAKVLIKELSDSIKANEAAKNTQMPAAPLGQFKSSNKGTDKRPTSASEWAAYYRGNIRGKR